VVAGKGLFVDWFWDAVRDSCQTKEKKLGCSEKLLSDKRKKITALGVFGQKMLMNGKRKHVGSVRMCNANNLDFDVSKLPWKINIYAIACMWCCIKLLL
jgi:hypothetical protein